MAAMVEINIDQVDDQLSNWVNFAKPAYLDNGQPTYLGKNGELLEGIYTEMPNDVYHALDALSSSGLKTFFECPAKYQRDYLSGISRKRTNAQRLTFDAGSYGHELCLEPHGFYERYFREPLPSDFEDVLHTTSDIEKALVDAGKPAKEGRNEKKARLLRLVPSANSEELKTIAQIDEQLEKNNLNKTESKLDKALRLSLVNPQLQVFDAIAHQNRIKHGDKESHTNAQGEEYDTYGGKRPIDGVVWDDAHRVQRTLLSAPGCALYITNGLPELAIIKRCNITGMMLKVKFDWLRFDDRAVDLKTTLSTKPEDFIRQMNKLHYDIQASFYTYVASLAGIYIKDFTFVTVEYVNLDAAHSYVLSEKRSLRSKMKLMDAIERFNKCMESNVWPGYVDSMRTTVIE
jgi:exodeoxyribonuclease VIII